MVVPGAAGEAGNVVPVAPVPVVAVPVVAGALAVVPVVAGAFAVVTAGRARVGNVAERKPKFVSG